MKRTKHNRGYIIYIHECGEILALQEWRENDKELRLKFRGVLTPQEVIKMYGGKCLKCGGKIEDKIKFIEVKSLKEVDIDEIKRKY